MKRTLVLIRHAKSSWSNPLQSDFERPLNDRGEGDAPVMGERLKKAGLIPDLIISSPAKRAKQTAKRIAGAVGYDKEAVQYEESLYHCIPSVFEEVILSIDDKNSTVYMVAHNPGISEFANEIIPGFKVGDMATCAVVAAQFEGDSWSDFNISKKELFLYDYPKNI
jgi:phosphohistidine phosphatase